VSLRWLLALACEALLLELALYRSLVRWLARRPDVPRGAAPIGYAQLVAPMLWLWIFGSATEVVVVEVVLQGLEAGWAEAVRLPLLIVGVWGVLWMFGMLAAYRVRPHLLTENSLVIRSGARTRVDLPLGAVRSVRSVEHDLPGVVRSLHRQGEVVLVGVGSRTNLELVLVGPTRLMTSKGEVTVERVGLWVDDPRAVAGQLGTLVSRGA
jgi:hypothetical protein